MTNKFSGKCACGSSVPASTGHVAKVSGKWVVTCAACVAPQDDWRVYTDRHNGQVVYFVGKRAWNACYSMTDHVGGECFTKAEAAAMLKAARALTPAQADAHRHSTNTDGRFEMACARGEFGAAWE